MKATISNIENHIAHLHRVRAVCWGNAEMVTIQVAIEAAYGELARARAGEPAQ